MKNKQYTQKPQIFFYDLNGGDMIDASNGMLFLSEDAQPPLTPPSNDKGYGGISWNNK